MSANPIVDVIRMMMEMYPDMTDPRGNVESGVGAPGTAGVGKAVTPFADTDPGIADPRNPTREEIDAITKSVMHEKMMKREMREGRFSEPPLPIRGLNPEIQRHMDDRPINGRNPLDEPRFHRYLEPDTPDPIGRLQQMVPQVLAMLTGQDANADNMALQASRGPEDLQQIRHGSGLPAQGRIMPLLMNEGDPESHFNTMDEAELSIPRPPSYPPVPGLLPKYVPWMKEDTPLSPIYTEPEYQQYLKPNTPEPIARMLPAIVQQLASLTQTYGGGTGQPAIAPHNINPTGNEDKALELDEAAKGIMDFTPIYPPQVGPQLEDEEEES